jgi:hypothetical protein
MKRMLLAAAASSLLVLAAPSVASAHHGKCHGRSHHACSHVRHAHHARLLKFGASLSTTATTTTPTPPASEPAGKVASFEGGVLTIMLTDGSAVSGKVTEQTEIRCESAAPTEGDDADDQGDESSGGNGEDSSSHVGFSSRGDDLSSGGGDDDGGDAQACTSTALVPGAVVLEAELSIGSGGAVWEHIDLIQ